MVNKIIISFFVFSMALLYACNPDCESTLRIPATVTPMGNQVLVATSPAEFLKGGPLYASNSLIVDEGSKVASPEDFNDAEGGYLITLSTGLLPATTKFFIRDEDCGGFIPLNTIFTCATNTNFIAEVTPNTRLLKKGVETEVLVSTIPGNFLEGKKIFIEKVSGGERVIAEARSSFMQSANGSIVTVPAEAMGMTTFFVEDEDCGGFIPLNSANIIDENLVVDNPFLFSAPAPPLITIPSVHITAPTNVVKTWFSPQDRDYCLWIVPQLKYIYENGIKIDSVELPSLMPGNPDLFGSDVEAQDGRASGTREISTSLAGICGEPTLTSYTYHLNPITGIVDRESGYALLSIDRRSKGGEVEKYEGMLIDPKTLQKEYRIGGHPCHTDDDDERPIIMVLTNEKTGQQLILYRIDLG